jgi:gluconolactonase
MVTELELVTDGLAFPEGPIAMPDGSVLLVEVRRGTLSRVAPDGTVSVVAECGGAPNGAAFGPDGHVYVCNNGGMEFNEHDGVVYGGHQPADYLGGLIQRVDVATGGVETVYDRCGEFPLRGPNDIVFDADGGFWFTDMGKMRARDRDHGGLYYASPDGSEIREMAYPLVTPNGVGVSPAGDRVYVADSLTGQIWYWDLEAPGVVKPQGGMFGFGGGMLLYQPPGWQFVDSLAVDSEGNVCVATIGEQGAITVVTPEGKVKRTVVIADDPMVTNICFGGPDLRTAFITSSGRGRLFATEWDCPGLALSF